MTTRSKRPLTGAKRSPTANSTRSPASCARAAATATAPGLMSVAVTRAPCRAKAIATAPRPVPSSSARWPLRIRKPDRTSCVSSAGS